MKINLNSGESLTVVMGGAATTTAPTAKADYADTDGPHSKMAALTGVTAVTLLSGPTNGIRPVESLSILNGDSVAQTITVSHVQGGTSYPVAIATLAAGDTLLLGEQCGVLNSSGVFKSGSAALSTALPDDTDLFFGTGSDFSFLFSTADASNHAAVLALDNTSQHLHITDQGAKASDWNLSAGTHPTVFVHSNTTPITDYLRLGNHDGTSAEVDVVGGTTLKLQIAGVTQAQLTAAGIDFIDDNGVLLGTGLDAALVWSTGDASDHGVVLALGDTSQMLHITDLAAIGTDWNITSPTHPTVYVHSNTTPITDYLEIGGHDGTTAHVDVVGGTTLELRIAGTAAVNILATGITLPAGQDLIFIGTTGQSEIHLTDNLADALSVKIIGGNDLIVFCTTNSNESVTINQNLIVGTKATGAGSTFVPFVPMGAHAAAVAPAAAIPITNYYSTLDSTAGATTATLANGAVIGQLKKIQMIVDNGDVVVTPANLAGGSTITFADVGDFALLIWDGTDWVAIELGNSADGATAPVLA